MRDIRQRFSKGIFASDELWEQKDRQKQKLSNDIFNIIPGFGSWEMERKVPMVTKIFMHTNLP